MENPDNGILIPPYHPGMYNVNQFPTVEDLINRSDNTLIKLMNWLKRPEISNCTDVKLLDKSQIFL